MEVWFPTMSMPPLPPFPVSTLPAVSVATLSTDMQQQCPLPAVFEIAEEEWTLQTRCIYAGLPPFPVSTFGYGYQYHSVHTEIGFGFQEQNLLFNDAVPFQRMMIPLDLFKSNVPKPELPSLPISAFSNASEVRKKSRSFPDSEVIPRVINPQVRSIWTCGDGSKAARMRRKRISERTTKLASLMPWARKMNISNMLEEARKYVKFLEAQVIALQYMPVESYFDASTSYGVGDGWGRLDTLNRQQLLQVLVNSRMVQENLYSKGLCLYSEEQMILVKKIIERKMSIQNQHQETQQLMVQGSGSSSVSS